MKIKAVIWDVDGTLLNTQEGLTAAYRYTIEQCQLLAKTDEELSLFIGPTPQTIFTTHFGLNEDEAQHAADIFRERYKAHDLFKASLYPSVEDVLSSLDKAGIQQAIATNKRQDYATEICKHFGIDGYCDPIVGADNENKLKKADLIKKCLKELEISDPSSVVMIGDTEGDKQAAKAAGVQFLGVNYGFGFINVPHYANSPEEILTILVSSSRICPVIVLKKTDTNKLLNNNKTRAGYRMRRREGSSNHRLSDSHAGSMNE